MNRACVFAHFDRDDLVDPYVLFYLEQLRPFCDHIVFVSTSKLSHVDLDRVTKIVNTALCKDNTGYDFMSWKVGLDSFDHSQFDEILLCNDSCYGPFESLCSIFDRMGQSEADFWGLTKSYQLAPHIQSYFFVFRASVVRSEVFKQFWQRFKILDQKIEIIKSYEVGLSGELVRAGFKMDQFFQWRSAFFPKYLQVVSIQAAEYLGKLFLWLVLPSSYFRAQKFGRYFSWHQFKEMLRVNYTHKFWDLCLRAGIPFIKIELIRDNPLDLNISGAMQEIRAYPNYDIRLIENHQNRIKRRTSK